MNAIQTNELMPETNIKLKFSTKISYGLGDFASNLSWCLVTTYLLFFYTDIFKLNLAAIGTLFFVARIWDAINDPIMGYIADKTRSKWGRFRPYLLYGPIFLSIFTVLCFFAPEINEGSKLIYAYFTYILLGMSYTIVNMPYGALAASMTQNSDERSSLAAFRVFFAVIGTIIVSSATLPLVQKFNDISGGSNGYFWTALIYAALMVPLYVIVFKKTNEVVKPSPRKKIPIKRTILVIAGNKPLLLIMISTLLASTCLFIRQSMLIYYFAYVVNNADMTALFLTLMALMMIVGIVLAAPISKKLGDKRATMLIGILVSGATCIGMYFTGPENISFLYAWIIIGSIFTGMTYVMTWSMVADTIEYGEWKTGLRADGVIYSTASFIQKLATALAGWGGALILSVTGYIPEVTQNAAVVSGINLSMTLIPGIALAVSAIPLFFYKLNRERYNRIVLEINQNKAVVESKAEV